MGFFKKFYFLILFISTSAYAAENINKSLIAAYLNNPKLNSEREPSDTEITGVPVGAE
jgi:hypothetical protein